MKIVITVVVLLSLAVAPAMQAQTEKAEWKAKMRAEYRAESEAGVRFTLRLVGEMHRLQLIEANMCESYRVRAKAIERMEREFPSWDDAIDLEEFPMMAASWHKEREADCRESIQRLQDLREPAEREISAYQSGERYKCCNTTLAGFGSAGRGLLVGVLHSKAISLCQQGRNQLHVKAGADAMLENPLLFGIALLDQKAGGLAQAVVNLACPLMDKYESWQRDLNPDSAAEIFDNRPGDP